MKQLAIIIIFVIGEKQIGNFAVELEIVMIYQWVIVIPIHHMVAVL